MSTKNSESFFNNCECPHFPCHKVIKKDEFNCLFCYCPLYNLNDCGGNFIVLENGVKDCSNCTLPHQKENYNYIMNKLK